MSFFNLSTGIEGILTGLQNPLIYLDGYSDTWVNLPGSDVSILTNTYYSLKYSRGDMIWNQIGGGVIVPLTGFYILAGNLYPDSTTGNGNGRVYFTINSTTAGLLQTAISSTGSQPFNILVFAKSGDKIDIRSNSFDPLRSYFGPNHTFAYIYYIS